MKLRCLFIVVPLVLPTLAIGDSWDFTEPHKARCSDGGQQDINRCLSQEYKRVDQKLNASYKPLVNLLQDSASLKKSQVAWIRFRDLTCEYENSGIGKEGSLYPYAEAACLIDLTEKRIRDLDTYLEWNCNGCPPRKEQ